MSPDHAESIGLESPEGSRLYGLQCGYGSKAGEAAADDEPDMLSGEPRCRHRDPWQSARESSGKAGLSGRGP